MLFNSFEFLIFFPVVTILFFLLPHKYRWFHLLAASCYFYMAFIPIYILILFGTIVIDYFAGLLIERSVGKKRRWMLIVSLVTNIGILCVFKYYNFFIDNANQFFSLFGSHPVSLPFLKMILPIGLSFHTFQAMSYTIEVFRGNYPAERHFGIYALYVMFYPQLVAGPIERPQNVLPQFHQEKTFDKDRVIIGLKIMLWGFFKKIVIADRLALYVNEVYGNPDKFGSFNLWLAVLVFFPFQIYCDFSGYSSIALGSAKVMGYDLMVNFRRPFTAITTTEFWNRWHISLSTWLRDYLYQPIVIELRDKGKLAIVFGLMVTFVISGFWHGAGYGFLVFGFLQGLAVTVEFLLGIKSVKLAKKKFGRLRGIVTTYFIWAISLVFFRAQSLEQALLILKRMFLQVDRRFVFSFSIPKLTYAFALFAILFLLWFEAKKLDEFVYQRHQVRKELALGSAMVIALIAFGLFHNLSFIYFQF